MLGEKSSTWRAEEELMAEFELFVRKPVCREMNVLLAVVAR